MDIYWILILFLFVMMAFQTYMAYKQNKKQQKTFRDFQSALKPGDEIVLNDGVYGTIESLEETTAKVRISANSVIKVQRNVIAKMASEVYVPPVVTPEVTEKKEEKVEEAKVEEIKPEENKEKK